MTLATLASAALLAMTPLAAAAQGQAIGSPGPPDWRADASPRLEAGASASLIGPFPGFGGVVTLPTGKKLSLEAVLETYPWVIEDGDEARLLTQLQARIPWAARPGLRRSFIVGVTAATVADKREDDGPGEWEFQSSYFPHGGVSWQWQKSPRFDLRLDVTAMVAVVPSPIPVPKIQLTTVWHTKRGAH